MKRTALRAAIVDGVWHEERGVGVAHRVVGYNEEITDKGYMLNAIVMACGYQAKPGSGELVPAFDVCNRQLCDGCKDYRAPGSVRKPVFHVGRIQQQ